MKAAQTAAPALGARNRHSTYVPMRDGVRLAVEVWLPEDPRPATTLCWFTRYWRASLHEAPRREYGDAVADAGFAFVHVDARGSGASFGERRVEYSDAEIADMGDVFDWIVAQNWSDGRIATSGVSYLGNTAELAATLNHPALRAAVPQYTDFDFFDQILFPGGLLNLSFAQNWGEFVRALDRNDVALLRSRFAALGYGQTRGVKPVEGAEDLLEQALRQHRGNGYYLDRCRHWLFRDDVAGITEDGAPILRKPLAAYAPALERAQTPMQHWIGWLDSATAAGAIARFAMLDAPNEFIIGPWNHGAVSVADPFAAREARVAPDAATQRAMHLDFVRKHAAGAAKPKKSITYYTMGAGVWRRTEVWPPAGVEPRRLYLSADGALSEQPSDELERGRTYRVDFEAGTGATNRWSTSMGGGPVWYDDRAAADACLLTYTGAPLSAPLTITGAPHITLDITSTHEDGAFIAYLEAVTPEGRVIYLTEGALRAIHRREQPHRTFLRADAWPLTPGARATLRFDLIPTAVRIPAGWRLRIALAGHDKDTFLRVPAEGAPVIEVFSTSCLVLPVDLEAEGRGGAADLVC